MGRQTVRHVRRILQRGAERAAKRERDGERYRSVCVVGLFQRLEVMKCNYLHYPAWTNCIRNGIIVCLTYRNAILFASQCSISGN